MTTPRTPGATPGPSGPAAPGAAPGAAPSRSAASPHRPAAAGGPDRPAAAGGPDRPAAAGGPGPERLALSALLKRAAVDARDQHLGRLADVIVRLDGATYPPVTGLVATVGNRRVFIPAGSVRAWQADHVELTNARVDLRAFERRYGEVLLRADVLGHRLLDVDAAQLVRAHDVELRATGTGWVLSGVAVRRTAGLRLPGLRERRPRFRDWRAFEPLIGHRPSLLIRAPLARLRRLRPAQLADLLEDASTAEQDEILTQVHADPELEADVFEELDEDSASQLFAARSDAQVAEVIAHMRADDAADAVTDLPQDRRQRVLDLLPPAQRAQVTSLLGYQTTTAGGLMGVDHLALPASTTAGAAVAAVAAATAAQPEALTTVYSLNPDGRLSGATSLVALVRADPGARLGAVAEPDPVRVPAHTDLIDVATVMADYNLLTLPVVDDEDRLIGVITVDDILEATIPDNWRQREHAPLHHPERPEHPDNRGDPDHPGTTGEPAR